MKTWRYWEKNPQNKLGKRKTVNVAGLAELIM